MSDYMDNATKEPIVLLGRTIDSDNLENALVYLLVRNVTNSEQELLDNMVMVGMLIERYNIPETTLNACLEKADKLVKSALA